MQKQIISLTLRKQVLLAFESDIASENVVPVRLYLKSKSFTSSSDLKLNSWSLSRGESQLWQKVVVPARQASTMSPSQGL